MALGSTVFLPPAGYADSPVTVTNPWFRYTVPQVPAGGYMTLTNHSSRPAVLTGAASAACGMLMLHRTETKNGADTMVEVPSITVPAGGIVAFAPGGYHLMCMQPNMTPGQSVPVTLQFRDGQNVKVMFPVSNINR